MIFSKMYTPICPKKWQGSIAEKFELTCRQGHSQKFFEGGFSNFLYEKN